MFQNKNSSPVQLPSVFDDISRRLFIGGLAGTAVSLTTFVIPFHKVLAPTIYMNYLSQLNSSLGNYILPAVSPYEIVSSVFNLKNAMRAIMASRIAAQGLSQSELDRKVNYIIEKVYAELARDLTLDDIKTVHAVHHNPLVRSMQNKTHQMGKIVSTQMAALFMKPFQDLVLLAVKDGQTDRFAPFMASAPEISDDTGLHLKGWMELAVNVNLQFKVEDWCSQICKRHDAGFSRNNFSENLHKVAAVITKIVEFRSFEALKAQIAPNDIEAVYAITRTPGYLSYMQLGWYFDRNLYGIATSFMPEAGFTNVLS